MTAGPVVLEPESPLSIFGLRGWGNSNGFTKYRQLRNHVFREIVSNVMDNAQEVGRGSSFAQHLEGLLASMCSFLLCNKRFDPIVEPMSRFSALDPWPRISLIAET